jgi:hypothetical protein
MLPLAEVEGVYIFDWTLPTMKELFLVLAVNLYLSIPIIMRGLENLQANGDKQQQDSSTSNPVSTQASTSRSAQGTADHTSQVETFSIPATGYDFDHRTMITVQSQQQQIPQDIWLHSPWHRVLYQPAWGYPLQPDNSKAPVEAPKTETNGHTDKGSSA